MVLKWLKGNKSQPTSTTKPSGESKAPPGIGEQPDGLVENAVAMAAGLEVTEAYYPGHDPIEYYGDGGFRFGDMSHQGALMFLPSGIRRWDVKEPHDITFESFEQLLREKENIEIILLGTGKKPQPLKRDLAKALRDEGLKLEMLDTGAAVRTLNILLSEDRAVAAGLLPVD